MKEDNTGSNTTHFLADYTSGAALDCAVSTSTMLEKQQADSYGTGFHNQKQKQEKGERVDGSGIDNSEEPSASNPSPTAPATGASNAGPVDPFDPMNLGISTDYAAAINAQTAVKAFEPRKPNNQEYFRVSPLHQHSLIVASITDKQDTGKVYRKSSRVFSCD